MLQDIFLFPGSVADNLRVFDDNDTAGARARASAAVAHADSIIEKLPGGYEGELAERGANLSVGERQLLSFARALAYDPPLLVLDEATSRVDPYTERLVQEALDRLLAGRTAVIVAHRLSTILNADRILLIHDGQVAESGQHEELLELDGLYAKLYRLQFAAPAAEAAAGVRAMKHIRWIWRFWQPHRGWLVVLAFLTLLSQRGDHRLSAGVPLPDRRAEEGAVGRAARACGERPRWHLIGSSPPSAWRAHSPTSIPASARMINGKLEMDMRQHYFARDHRQRATASSSASAPATW